MPKAHGIATEEVPLVDSANLVDIAYMHVKS